MLLKKLELAIPAVDLRALSPGIERRGYPDQRQQDRQHRKQRDEQSVDQDCQPEGQISLQQRRAVFVESLCLWIDRQAAVANGWKFADVAETGLARHEFVWPFAAAG